jgi:alginate O-acetyltransferase complex protein AlgI
VRGEPVTAAAAWGACAAFIIQIFFDFSGYSEMAVGLGLLFNFRLPINFAAPLRATNMFDLWRRWHITLSRLARDLIYVPLSRGDVGTIRRSLNLFLTMVVIGIWHGAGWPFVVWGAYNGVLLWINQIWQTLVPGRPSRGGRAIGWVLTFAAFVSGGVFFRSPDMTTAWHLITAMVGLGDAPVAAHLALDWDDWLISQGVVSDTFLRTWFGTSWTMVGMLWTLGALAIILVLPDTMEIVDYREGDAQSHWRRPAGWLKWRPSWPALVAVAILFFAAFSMIGRVSEFFYYQF